MISSGFNNAYLQEIHQADLTIFTGGGLISGRYKRLIKRIDEIAETLGITVRFNAVGVEGYKSNRECEI